MNWKLIEDKSWCSLEQQFEWVREMNTVQQDIRYHADRKSTRLNSSHANESRMPSSA